MEKTLHQLAIEQFSIGDIIKVCFKIPSNFGGWKNGWTREMDNLIGHIFSIGHIDNDKGIIFREDVRYYFPAICLERANFEFYTSKENKKFRVAKDTVVFTCYPHQPRLENIVLTREDIGIICEIMDNLKNN